MRRFAAEADANGCVLYTLPAEASLYAWYRSVMGTTQTARGARLRIARAPDMQRPPVIERVSAQEYAALREQALRGRAHVELSAALLAFQADLCDLCGGALVRNHLYLATMSDHYLVAGNSTVKVLARGGYRVS